MLISCLEGRKDLPICCRCFFCSLSSKNICICQISAKPILFKISNLPGIEVMAFAQFEFLLCSGLFVFAFCVKKCFDVSKKTKNAQSTHKRESFAMHSGRKFKREFHQSNPGRIDVLYLEDQWWFDLQIRWIPWNPPFSVESQNTGCKWNVINSSVIILCRNSKQLAKLWGFEADVSLNG